MEKNITEEHEDGGDYMFICESCQYWCCSGVREIALKDVEDNCDCEK